MKLNKRRLLLFIQKSMSDLGYVEFPDTISDADLFVKPIGELYLTVGFTIHRFYDDQFTCTYYLSRTTNWAECWGDIPHRLTYIRPGELMSLEERLEITVDSRCKKNPQITDMWWNAFDGEGNYDQESLASFVEAIKLTEGRVAQQPEIIEKIYASTLLKTIYEDVNGTIEYAISEDFREDLLFQPKREVKVIPMKWFKAAETHIRSGFSSTPASSLVVKHRAYDAYRVYHMRNL